MTQIAELTTDIYKKDFHSYQGEELDKLVEEFKLVSVTVKDYLGKVLDGTVTTEMLYEHLEDEELASVEQLKEDTDKEKFSAWLSDFNEVEPLKVENYLEFSKLRSLLNLLYEVIDNSHPQKIDETVNIFIDNYPFKYSFDELGI